MAVTSPDYHKEGEDAPDAHKAEMDAYMRQAYSQMLDGLEDDNLLHHWSATGRDVEFRNTGLIGGTWCGSRHDEDQLWTNRPIPEPIDSRISLQGECSVEIISSKAGVAERAVRRLSARSWGSAP